MLQFVLCFANILQPEIFKSPITISTKNKGNKGKGKAESDVVKPKRGNGKGKKVQRTNDDVEMGIEDVV